MFINLLYIRSFQIIDWNRKDAKSSLSPRAFSLGVRTLECFEMAYEIEKKMRKEKGEKEMEMLMFLL